MIHSILSLVLLLLASIQNYNVTFAFNGSRNAPTLKGSASQYSKPKFQMHASNPDTEPTTKYSRQKRPKHIINRTYTKNSRNTSKQTHHLKIFNSKLTKCESASQLLQMFIDQTSSKNHGGDTATAATHLAGAKKINSVNYATCLHRLARFASNTYNNQDGDEWKTTLSDPRFALLMCSIAEMGARADASISVKEGKAVVEKWEIDSMMNIDDGMRTADDVLNEIVGVSSVDDMNGDDHLRNDSKNEIDRKRELAEVSMNQLVDPKRRSAFSSRECKFKAKKSCLFDYNMNPIDNVLLLHRLQHLLGTSKN